MTGAASRSRVTAIVLAVIVIAAVVLRVRGLSFGLPAVYNPDEIAIMSRALGFAKGDLNPHNFLYPSLYFYALFAWVAASFAVDWLLGIFGSIAQFQQSLSSIRRPSTSRAACSAWCVGRWRSSPRGGWDPALRMAGPGWPPRRFWPSPRSPCATRTT